MKKNIIAILFPILFSHSSFAADELLFRDITYSENPYYNPRATLVPDSGKSHIIEGYIYNTTATDVHNVRLHVKHFECISKDKCFLISEQIVPALTWNETIDPSLLYFGATSFKRTELIIPPQERRAFKGLIFLPADSNKSEMQYSYEIK